MVDAARSDVIVTGAAGFIGSATASTLLARGHRVLGADLRVPTVPGPLANWRLARLRENPRFAFSAGDARDPGTLKRLSNRFRPQAFYHLAARAGVRLSTVDPWDYVRTNIEGTLNALEACRVAEVPVFVLASTSSVYGAAGGRPTRESALTDQLRSPYAASKKGAEDMAIAYGRLYGLRVAIVRYFTVYGPGGRPDMSVFRFIEAILRGRPLALFGSGNQRRDFTYIEDIAQGTVAAAKVKGVETLNLGFGRPATVNQLIEEIAAAAGKPAHVRRQPAHASDVEDTWADTRKAREVLGWRPRVSLKQGVARSVEWHRANRPLLERVRI